MSTRSSQPPPGPPPSGPPPPVPSSNRSQVSSRATTRTPLPSQSPENSSPHSAQSPRKQRARPSTLWPASATSQHPNDTTVWPVKAPPKPNPVLAPPHPPHAPSIPSAGAVPRRSSLSSLSLNRFSFHRARPRLPEELLPSLPETKPVRKPSLSATPPSTSNKASGKTHENKARSSGTHAVQRRVSGVERRVNGLRSHGSASSRTPPRTPTVPTHTVDDPIQTNSHAKTPTQVPAHTLQKKRSFFKRVAEKLTRSHSTLKDDYKARPPSVHSALIPEVPSIPPQRATLSNDALALENNPSASHTKPSPAKDGPPPQSTLSPAPNSTSDRKNRQTLSIKVYGSENSRNVLPSSPRPEAILAAMSRQTASLRQPPSPVGSTRLPASSTRHPLSPVPSMRHRLSPVPSTQEPPSPVTSTRQSPTARHNTSTSPRRSSPARSAATGSTTPHLPSPSYFHLPPQGLWRTDERDSDRERERDQSWEQGRDGVPSPRHLPSPAEDEESEEEEERRQSEAKVSQWLTPDSPTTSSSLDHSLSHSQSSHSQSAGGRAASGKRFGGGFRGIDEESGNGFGGEGMDAWRGAVMSNEEGEEDLLPEVERMALEAEERVRMRGGEWANANVMEKGGGKEGNVKKAGRQLSLFRKWKGKGEDGTALGTYSRPRARIAIPSDRGSVSRRSLSFLSTSPVTPTTPNTPSMTLAPPTTGEPTATPRPRKPTANPTMHTRGSILLETKGIEDPEVRRVSEMVFLS